MQAIILSIGDELVLGQTVDTNSAWISAELAAVGVAVRAHVTVADDQKAIAGAMRRCAEGCDVLLVSGGLGPTEDDLTRQALAEMLGVPLEVNAAAMQQLEGFFRRLGREMTPSNRVQGMAPRRVATIENTAGTAPGLDARFGGCRIFVMPGVPGEMKTMFRRSVLPMVREAGGSGVIVSRTLHTFGLGESVVGERLGALMKRGRNPSVGTTVAGGVVSLRVNASFASAAEAAERAARIVEECRGVLGDLIYGEGEQTLADVVGGLLRSRRPVPTVSTAESCTGGLVAKMLTDVAGASAYFRQGWVCYEDGAKERLLGVGAELLAEQGAVSEAVAVAMAAGARERAAAEYALAITGIAGPDGGTAEKPVGTVCIALATVAGPRVRTFRFSGDRGTIRDRSAKMALSMLRFELLGKPMPF